MKTTSIWDQIFHPEIHKSDLESNKQQSTLGNPFLQMMMEEYIARNPNKDYEGTAFEPMQKRYLENMVQQGGPLYKSKKDESGKVTGYMPKKGAKEKLEASPMTMTRQGPEFAVGSNRKDIIFGKIQEKKAQKIPLSKMETQFEKKYLGISDSKEGPTTLESRIKVRKMATDMAKSKAIQSSITPDMKPIDQNDTMTQMKNYQPSEAEIQATLPEAVDFLYPNRDVTKDEKTLGKFNIELPEGISKLDQVVKFLKDNGVITEDNQNPVKSAADWLEEQGIGISK